MKRTLSLILAGLLCLTLSACGDTQPEQTAPTTTTTQTQIAPAITVEDFTWELTTEKEGKDTYMAFTFQNNSSATLASFKLKFKDKPDATEEQLDAYWADLKKSQGDNADIDEMRAALEVNNLPILLYGKTEKSVAPGEKVTVRCRLNDQLESRNVIHPDLYTPYMMELTYQEDGVTYYIRYNFDKDKYFCDEM